MGLPYYSKQRELRDDVNVFMGTLLNVYVFLLLIAGAVAIIITNSLGEITMTNAFAEELSSILKQCLEVLFP